MKFYVPTEEYMNCEDNPHPMTVYAEGSDHFAPDYISLGFVSKQTPLGQGIYCGFPRNGVRQATKEEVLEALKKNHPHGKQFRPSCQEAMNAQFQLIMSQAVRNWTNDSPGSARPIHDVSRQEIIEFRESTLEQHMEMLSRWDEITAAQIEEIKAHFDG